MLLGGEIQFRHVQEIDSTLAVWSDSYSIGTSARGNDLLAVLPLKSGTYLARVFNRQGLRSAGVAKASTKQAALLPFASVGGTR